MNSNSNDNDEEAQKKSEVQCAVNSEERVHHRHRRAGESDDTFGYDFPEESEYHRGYATGCISTFFKCFIFPWYCGIRECIYCLSRNGTLRLMYCLIVLAGLILAHGYIVLINDLIAHSYASREARGLYTMGDKEMHGTPHVIEQTQRFYS